MYIIINEVNLYFSFKSIKSFHANMNICRFHSTQQQTLSKLLINSINRISILRLVSYHNLII